MFARKLTVVVSLALAILTAAGGTASARPRGDQPASGKPTPAELRLREYQKPFLDPRADNGEYVAPPSSDPHAGHHGQESATTSTDATAMPPESGGRWDYLPSLPSDFNAVHVVASPTGKILLVAGSGNNKVNFEAGSFTSYIWDPVTNERRMIPTPEDLFCAGHVLLPDGRALVGGGTSAYGPFLGSTAMYAFDFETEVYEPVTRLQVGRWYPSVITGPDGRQLFVGGFDETGKKTNIAEIYDPVADTTTTLPARRTFPNYPRIHLAANGKYFQATTATPGFWDPFASTYQKVGGGTAAAPNAMASCFVGDVRDQNLMVMGGGWPATNTTRIIDLDAPQPTFRPGPTLGAAKAYLSCVNLPDGTLFEANGGSDNRVAAASPEAAILQNHTSAWTPAAPLPAGEHRLYHSLLFLLDNGQVISMSSNPQGGTSRSSSLLVYSPPYLFTGQRPIVTQAPVEVAYGGTYPVAATATGGTVDRMTVTSAPSPTHSMDSNQRYLSLPVVNGQIAIPTSRTILPPGWYRLWAVDSLGRPSVAHWIHLT